MAQHLDHPRVLTSIHGLVKVPRYIGTCDMCRLRLPGDVYWSVHACTEYNRTANGPSHPRSPLLHILNSEVNVNIRCSTSTHSFQRINVTQIIP